MINQDTGTQNVVQANYTPSNIDQPEDRTGTMLSVAGLVAWLSAMLLAVAGPLFDLQIPPSVIVGMVAFSAAFSVLSLPKLIGLGKRDDDSKERHA